MKLLITNAKGNRKIKVIVNNIEIGQFKENLTEFLTFA